MCKRSFFSSLSGAALILALSLTPIALVHAHNFAIGELTVEHPYSVSTNAFSRNGVMYLKHIKNNGSQPDKLIAARTPAAATVEIHTMKMDGNVMRMREVSGIELPAKAEVKFGPSSEQGYHLMLMGLKNRLSDGDKFPVFLKFEKAGELEVTVTVQKTKELGTEHKH